MSTQTVLYGKHAVFSALNNPKRNIKHVLCTKENFQEIQKKHPHVKAKIVDKKEIEKLVGKDSVHQGFALLCDSLETYCIEDICNMAENVHKCHVLILDQVTDPQNIGAIIRSAVAFGTLALVVQDKNCPPENGSMAKASVGLIEHLPIARVTNLSRAIEKLKNAGFWVVGLDGYATDTLSTFEKPQKTAIILGSEGKGMRRLIEENCDYKIKIPMNNKAESLNVSNAAAIVLYEFYKDMQ